MAVQLVQQEEANYFGNSRLHHKITSIRRYLSYLTEAMILAFTRNPSLSAQPIFRRYQSTRYCGHVILLDILNIPPQSQLISEIEIVSEHDHLLLWKRLSEVIGDLIRSDDEYDV